MICSSLIAVVINSHAIKSLLLQMAVPTLSCGCGVIPVVTSYASFLSRTVTMRVFQGSQLPSFNFSIFGNELDMFALVFAAWIAGADTVGAWEACPLDPVDGPKGSGGG